MNLEFVHRIVAHLKNVDVVRQKCWNKNNDLSILNLIDKNYYGIGVAASFSERSLQALACLLIGGLACLY